MHRNEPFFEKLSTADVTVADLIGDVDPIKAATLKLTYADEKVLHFGMIPRAHRCIFVLNELPDLQARIQVALLSILQEKEIQVRGFKLRLPLEIQFIFTVKRPSPDSRCIYSIYHQRCHLGLQQVETKGELTQLLSGQLFL